jgi:drug/metabolite transporter (DMT)-like permease
VTATGTLGRHTLASLAPRERGLALLALAAVYLFWGSSYFAIRLAIDAFPPLLMAGCRHLAAGLILLPILLLCGKPWPGAREWGAGSLVGTILLMGGNGMVSTAEQWVSTSLASLVIATVPLWTLFFARFTGHRSTPREWTGVALGLSGVALLSLEKGFSAHGAGLLGFALLLVAALSWAVGSVWSTRLPVAPGFMGAATQMVGGGAVMIAVALLKGDRLSGRFPLAAVAGWAWLVVFGSVVGFTAYLYLLNHVRPTLSASYAYVNPVVAILLGTLFLGETLSLAGVAATAVILAGVILTMIPPRGAPGREEGPPPPASRG